MSVRWIGCLLSCLVAGWGEPAHAEPPAVSRVLFGSCVNQNLPAPIFERMLQADPELLIFLGDNVYADTAGMQVMRDKYQQLAALPRFEELRQHCPVLAIWDDHDYGQNDGGADFAQRAASQEVFVDFWGDPPDSPRRKRPGVYDAHLFGPAGQRLQVILLDTRYFRSPLQRGERRTGGPYVADPDPNKTMLGEAQWQWLEKQLREPAELRIIATGIQFAAEAAGQETWSNLPAERQRMIQLIRRTGAEGVLFLSGDRHWSEVSAVRDGAPYVLYDITSSSLNQIHPRGTPTDNRNRIHDTTCHVPNFGILQIDWSAPHPTVMASIVCVDGSVPIQIRITGDELRKP